MKVLVISKENYFGEAMALAIKSLDSKIETIVSGLDEAMEMFLMETPSRVLVCNYIKLSPPAPVEVVFNDLKLAATEEKIFRCGLDTVGEADYIQLPCSVVDLKRILE